jgi:hypothetical protein
MADLSTPRRNPRRLLALAAAMLGAAIACKEQPGQVLDEAARARVPAWKLSAAGEDYFHDMDGGPGLTPAEVRGRNTWMVWTGGNDRLWDLLASESAGVFDLIKVISSHPELPYKRTNRWAYLGLVNEPCFEEPKGPDPKRWGLWLDVRKPNCPEDPFADPVKYPGVKIGARGKTVDIGSYYGEPTGIAGLRLFPNPDFDEDARREWDAEKFYRDDKYYYRRKLVRPYRVGMSCAFCHVGPNPVHSPANPEAPAWADLSSNVGAQYFWVDRIFNWKAHTNPDSFFFQLFHTSRPGTLDTSLVSTDNINNPRTMNAVYALLPRLLQAQRFGKESMSGGELDNMQFNNFVPPADPLAQFFAPPGTTWTPRVLKDGADSVGVLGALNRVYLNIGLFSEEWLLHFRPLIGGQRISPIEIAVARRNSVYWQATEQQTPDMGRFFLKTTGAHRLQDVPEGQAYLRQDPAPLVDRGKEVFAATCARCHSTKLPPMPPGLDMAHCNGKDYLQCWNQYWAWTKQDRFKEQMRAMVFEEDFLDNNYLSNEFRVPVTLLQTNACSPLATNALAGNIWDNFSSDSYKQLPSVGSITVRSPRRGGPTTTYQLPGGGRGFTRPASLVSLWSTAPFLLNNSVGVFNPTDNYGPAYDYTPTAAVPANTYGYGSSYGPKKYQVRPELTPNPSIETRMRAFQDGIEKMLWPERREKDKIFGDEVGPGVGSIDRTTADAFINVPEGYIPDGLRPLVGVGRRLFPMFFRGHDISLGPIPEGFPIAVMSNLDLRAADEPLEVRIQHLKVLLQVLKQIKRDQKARVDVWMDPEVIDRLVSISKCPDYVVNKGHYFGTTFQTGETPLSDADKRALIAYLKTF